MSQTQASSSEQKQRRNPLIWLLLALVALVGVYFLLPQKAEPPVETVQEQAPPPADTVAAPQPEPTAVVEPVKQETPVAVEKNATQETPKQEPAAKPAVTPVSSPVAKEEKPKPKKQEPKEEVVILVDESPEPQKGYPDFYRYIKQNLKYPDEAKKNKAEGKVMVEFVVQKDGSLRDIKIQHGIGYGCDEEAIRVVQEGGKWKPAKVKSEPVLNRVTIPIVFKLN